MKHTMRLSHVAKIAFALMAVVLTTAAGTSHAQGFTPGNLVISRVGDGSAALTSASTSVFLDEYTTATGQVAPFSSLALPTAANGTNNPFTTSGSATSEGALTLSTNGQYLLIAGYNAAPGVTKIASTAASATAREVGRITVSDRTIDTTTTISDAYSGNNIRSAASTNGTDIFTGGVQPVGDNGVRYTTDGTAASTQLSTDNPINVRVVNISGGQLYESTGGSTSMTNPYAAGIYSLGTGTPTTGGQTATLFVPTSTTNPYDFVFADNGNTVYVADNSAGIQKYMFDGNAFNLAYTFTGSGLTGLTATTDGQGNNVLYSVNPGNIFMVTDTGSAATLNSIALAGPNTAFRGIEFIPTVIAPTPEPGSLATLLIGFGALGLLVARRRRRAALNETLT